MTPSHAVKKDTRYRYYVSRSLITKDRAETSAGLRIPAAEIEHLVSSRVHRWLLDPGSIYKSNAQATTPGPRRTGGTGDGEVEHISQRFSACGGARRGRVHAERCRGPRDSD